MSAIRIDVRDLRVVDRFRAPLDDDGAASLVEVLAASLPSQSEQLAAVAARETRVEQLTQDQAHLLDRISAFARVRVVSGAGTGRT